MENYLNIKNKVVVISGAAGFLANTLIIEFLKNGAEVYGIDNNYKMLMSQYKKIKNKYFLKRLIKLENQYKFFLYNFEIKK